MTIHSQDTETSAVGVTLGSMSTPSVLSKERSRVLPRVSFRLALGIVTAVAFAALSYRYSQSGSILASAFVDAATTLIISFVVYALLFLIAWIPAVVGRDHLEDVNRGSPFAADQLPPQLLTPRDPGT